MNEKDRETSDELGLETSEQGASGLGPAHRGYVYQDVATAYFLAEGIVSGAECTVVDRKEYAGDLFDDLTIEKDKRRIRRQFKSSADVNKTFAEEALKTKTNDLRIDDIVHCFLRAGEDPADEYRICTTWSTPQDENVAKLLRPCDAVPSFEGYPTKLYRLNLGEIWPEDGELIWDLRSPKSFRREDLAAFCDRLTIELECPQITLDFADPGPLQILLRALLSDKIGVGRYPNRELRPEDAAIRMTYRASLARARQESLTPTEVLRDLGLRTDFGRVIQKFPVIPGHLVSREGVLQELFDRVMRERTVVLTGPPGSGKSWILTRFAEKCKDAGLLVVRHYCYLEPGDEHREHRITTDVLFGNLIAEFFDAHPTLETNDAPRFSAGRGELEKLLEEAKRANPARRILLIVDGVDHIGRVLAEARRIAPYETRIVEELVNLQMPDGVCLVVGAQPGAHLEPLAQLFPPLELPGWEETEIGRLADRLGTLRAVAEAFGDDQVDLYIKALHERSGGNPLYATYLCRATRAVVEAGGAKGPTEVVNQAPHYDENLTGYYRYLVGGGIPDVAASILAYIDFAVTDVELGQIYPEIAPHLAQQLAKLSPILTDVTVQGGLRVYHESFRRFIVEALTRHPEHRDAVLQRITEWLRSRGFPDDPRAYRYLLIYLLRRSCYADILDLVDVDFVSTSLMGGYPAQAILDNIAVASEAAATTRSWPTLCRLAEIRKSVETCFQEKLDFEHFIKANLAINGPERLAAQLLFEGRPTRSRDEGLIACSLCDDAGAMPPWQEYLELTGSERFRGREAAALAEFHGRARTASFENITSRVGRWLQHAPAVPPWYMRGVLDRLSRVHGSVALEAIRETPDLPDQAMFQVQLAMAQAELKAGHAKVAAEHANIAASLAGDVAEAHECVELGADPNGVAGHMPSLEDLTREMVNLSQPDEERTREWIAAVGLGAFLDPIRVEAIRNIINVEGWYTAWLHFVISVSLLFAETDDDPGKCERAVCRALAEIAAEESPFRGSPRACDLYSIRQEISSVWEKSISLLQSVEAMAEAMRHLSHISSSTTTYLQGSPEGPLTMDEIVSLAETLLDQKDTLPAAVEMITEQVQRVETGFYEIQAGLEMRLAEAYVAAGRQQEAYEHWERACQCLCAYGSRKDITIFELINSLLPLIHADTDRAKACLRDLQRLVESLDERTNGRETKGALVDWFKKLAAAGPEQAAALLARSLVRNGGLMSWRLEECLNYLLRQSKEDRSDLLLALSFTSPPSGAQESVEQVLGWIRDLLTRDPEEGLSAWHRFLGRMQALVGKLDTDTHGAIAAFGLSHGLPPLITEAPQVTPAIGDERDEYWDSQSRADAFDPEKPLFAEGVSLSQIARTISGLGYHTRGRTAATERLINGLGYRILHLAHSGRLEDAAWLINAFAREARFEAKTQILAGIASGLDRYGQTEFAAVAYALSSWYSHSERIWFTGFGESDLALLARGRDLDTEAVASALSGEVHHKISATSGYYFGLTCRLVEIVLQIEGVDAAFNCWYEAFRAIQHRLPEWQPVGAELLRYDPIQDVVWSLDEALAFLLLSRVSHPDLERRQAALAGLAGILEHEPNVLGRGLEAVLNRDTPLTSMLLILATVLEAERAPFPLTRRVEESLHRLRACDLYGLRVVAERLLARLTDH